MSLYDYLLFVHVFGAFALVAGTTAMAPYALGLGRVLERGELVRMASVGAILSGVGATLTLVIGLWLVGNVGYHFFRLWIVAALALWAMAGYSNDRVRRAAQAEAGGGERTDVRMLWVIDASGAALLLADMLFKRGH